MKSKVWLGFVLVLLVLVVPVRLYGQQKLFVPDGYYMAVFDKNPNLPSMLEVSARYYIGNSAKFIGALLHNDEDITLQVFSLSQDDALNKYTRSRISDRLWQNSDTRVVKDIAESINGNGAILIYLNNELWWIVLKVLNVVVAVPQR